MNENTAYEELNQIIPFGKYRGQPASVLANDKQYCDWLSGQDWFRERYQTVYNVIINNFTKPEDTPEHNNLQGKFLDEDFRKKFLYTCLPDEFTISNPIVKKDEALATEVICQEDVLLESVPDRKVKILFEVKGWDVAFRLFSVKKCVDAWDNDFNRIRKCKIHILHGCHHFIELKPTLGDDFPSVLRQMQANTKIEMWKCEKDKWLPSWDMISEIPHSNCWLVYGKYTGTGVTEQQMRQLFAMNGFAAVRLDEIESFDLAQADDFCKIETVIDDEDFFYRELN